MFRGKNSNVACKIADNLEPRESGGKYFEESMWKIAEAHLKEEQKEMIEKMRNASTEEERRNALVEIDKIVKKLRTNDWRKCCDQN